MRKLLQINVTANWGSTGKIAESIGLTAIQNGWESYLAYGRYSNPSQSHLIQVGSRPDVYAHYAEQRIRDNEGLASRGATRKLIQQIREIQPDVVQLHNIHDHYLNYRLLFEYLNTTDIQVVWTFHDCWAFTGHCFHFVTEGCERWKTQCRDCPLQHSSPNTLLDRSRKNYEEKKRLFAGCKHLTIVPCSDWMGGFVKESFLKDKRMQVIHNGVDLKVFQPSLQRKKQNVFRILAVSNVWHQAKGLYDLYELRKRLPDGYELTMVGLSAEQLKELPEGIRGIQRTQHVQELAALYGEADVLVNPTYADTFPTVNLEALACGTPVITYRTGGSPEAVDEKTGIVVPQGDVDALVAAIRQLREHPLSGENCRKRAEEHFDKDLCFQQYIDLYNRLLG
ncbi:glycosyltransferase, group 1 family protein [gut metagenome]|uniref:Glycosyltransferase, group 1 family protein n=1 Tax=gut metagenome TaxID=749906 RepID=J9H389_9ZZZZ